MHMNVTKTISLCLTVFVVLLIFFLKKDQPDFSTNEAKRLIEKSKTADMMLGPRLNESLSFDTKSK